MNLKRNQIWSPHFPLVLSLLIAIFFVGFLPGQDLEKQVADLRDKIRAEFGIKLPPIPVPENNQQSLEKIELGEALFFDPNLSSCGEIACAPCHIPERGFSDGEKVSDGCGGATGRRNSNSVYQNAFLSHLFSVARAGPARCCWTTERILHKGVVVKDISGFGETGY